MGFFSKLKFGLKLTAETTKARLALPSYIETAKEVRCNAAQLRVIKREAALLGAPDTFLDAVRRIIESFESVETTNVEAACACQAVVNATDEKQIDLARTEAAVFIANEAMNAANAARARALQSGPRSDQAGSQGRKSCNWWARQAGTNWRDKDTAT